MLSKCHVPQTVSIPFSEKMAKDGKMIIEYHDEDVLVSISNYSGTSIKGTPLGQVNGGVPK